MNEKDYYLRGRHDEVKLECIELTHPDFTQTYRFVRNHLSGVQIMHDDGNYYNYDYSPITVRAGQSADSLARKFTLGIGDLGGTIPMEVDRLRNGNYPSVRPTVNIRTVLSSDLTDPISTIKGLQVTDNNPTIDGAVLSCQARELNKSKTGIVYLYYRFETLRSF